MQPDSSSPGRLKGRHPAERPQSDDRERFLPATGAIILQLPEYFSASGLPDEARRQNKSSRVGATVSAAERPRKRRGSVPEGVRKRRPPAWTALLRNPMSGTLRETSAISGIQPARWPAKSELRKKKGERHEGLRNKEA